jgi:hypothetical protein
VAGGRLGDGIHQWTERQNRWLRANPGAANALLIATSALIDALGLYLLASAVFGPSFRPRALGGRRGGSPRALL